MIVDMVTFRVRPERIAEFEKHNEDWVRMMRRARGFITQVLMRSLDHPHEFTAEVRWVNREYRDRFNVADDPDRKALQQRAHDLLDGPPRSVLLESV